MVLWSCVFVQAFVMPCFHGSPWIVSLYMIAYLHVPEPGSMVKSVACLTSDPGVMSSNPSSAK